MKICIYRYLNNMTDLFNCELWNRTQFSLNRKESKIANFPFLNWMKLIFCFHIEIRSRYLFILKIYYIVKLSLIMYKFVFNFRFILIWSWERKKESRDSARKKFKEWFKSENNDLNPERNAAQLCTSIRDKFLK
jgi:hypothetical protein